MPAQWKKLPLRTQQELISGRDALNSAGLVRYVDSGVDWLNAQFSGKLVTFSTSVDIDRREVLLMVWEAKSNKRLFSVVEKIEEFVTPATLTKIILVAG